MKKAVFIVVCILGILCLSSCRSTSQSCGLADHIDNSTTIQTSLKQGDFT